MPLQSDKQYKKSWANNTTPLPPDAAGNVAVTLAGFVLTNAASAARSVKFFDKASAPTVGSDVPVRTYNLAANTSVVADFARGKLFTLGMWVTVTANAGDSDNTASSNNDVLVTVDYQT